MKSSSIFRSIVAAVTMTFGLSTSSAFADCPADLNGDHRVDGADLSILLNDWNSVSTPQFDLNHDGTINGADLAVLIGHWGPCGFGATQGITLVIDPTDLNLLDGCPGCSAWVVGYANVLGGCIKITQEVLIQITGIVIPSQLLTRRVILPDPGKMVPPNSKIPLP